MPEKGMRKCIFAAAAAVAVLLSDIGGTAVYAGENVPYETYNYDIMKTSNTHRRSMCRTVP